MKTKEEELKRLKEYALWLLGRRDYSEYEIQSKFKDYIKKKEFISAEDDYTPIIDKLKGFNYIDDERMANSIIRNSSLSFRGPMKIKQNLSIKKLDESFLSNFEEDEIDWFELCKQYYLRKYPEKASDYNEQGKRFRHLVGRGYYPDHIKYAMEDHT